MSAKLTHEQELDLDEAVTLETLHSGVGIAYRLVLLRHLADIRAERENSKALKAIPHDPCNAKRHTLPKRHSSASLKHINRIVTTVFGMLVLVVFLIVVFAVLI